MSHDIEGIIAVFDGRNEIVAEVKSSGTRLIKELSERFSKVLKIFNL